MWPSYGSLGQLQLEDARFRQDAAEFDETETIRPGRYRLRWIALTVFVVLAVSLAIVEGLYFHEPRKAGKQSGALVYPVSAVSISSDQMGCSYEPLAMKLITEQPLEHLFSRKKGQDGFGAADVVAVESQFHVTFTGRHSLGRVDHRLNPGSSEHLLLGDTRRLDDVPDRENHRERVHQHQQPGYSSIMYDFLLQETHVAEFVPALGGTMVHQLDTPNAWAPVGHVDVRQSCPAVTIGPDGLIQRLALRGMATWRKAGRIYALGLMNDNRLIVMRRRMSFQTWPAVCSWLRVDGGDLLFPPEIQLRDWTSLTTDPVRRRVAVLDARSGVVWIAALLDDEGSLKGSDGTDSEGGDSHPHGSRSGDSSDHESSRSNGKVFVDAGPPNDVGWRLGRGHVVSLPVDEDCMPRYRYITGISFHGTDRMVAVSGECPAPDHDHRRHRPPHECDDPPTEAIHVFQLPNI